MKNIRRAFVAFIVLAAIYVGTAFGLANAPQNLKPAERSAFRSIDKVVQASLHNTCPIARFKARDGADLAYRVYKGSAHRALVIIHGASAQSDYLGPLAQYLADSGAATVYTPDVRGHGHSGVRRGDVDYVGQLDDDTSDFLQMVRERQPSAKIILAGHSQGGGMTLRAQPKGSQMGVSAYALIAPFVDPMAPMIKRDGNFASPNIPAFLGLGMLNAVGLSSQNARNVLHFHIPDRIRTDRTTVDYTYRLVMSTVPGSQTVGILKAMPEPLLVIIAGQDELFDAPKMSEYFRQKQNVQIEVLDDADHLSIALDDRTKKALRKFVEAVK